MIAALEVLNHISVTQNGLASSVQDLHYIWTYTPTAVLTIISALWARTEFQAKQNAPWRSLQKPEEAEKSLLLDYDNIPPVALWKSFKHRHFIVAAGVLCSLLLQLSILFSTSLLSLQIVQMDSINIPIELHTAFDSNPLTFDDAKLEAFDVVNGLQFENMSYPSGTDKYYAFQEFSAPTAPRGSVITAPIQAMEADIECERATLRISDDWAVLRDNNSFGGVYARFGSNIIATPSCTIYNTSLEDTTMKGYSPYRASMQSATCANLPNGTDQSRILLFAIKYHEGKLLKNETDRIPTFWSRKWQLVLDNSAQFICKPRFSFVNMLATANSSQTENSPKLKRLGIEDADFPNLNTRNITERIMDLNPQNSGDIDVSYMAQHRPIAAHPAFLDDSPRKRPTDIDYRIQLGAWIAGNVGGAEKLFEEGVLLGAASAFYRSMAAQVIHNGLVKQRTAYTNGTASFHENRVLVMQSPLRVLQACMGSLALIATAMVIFGPCEGSLPQNPSNILTIANIMSKSQILRRSLHRAGALSNDFLKERLSANKYFLQTHRESLSIEADSEKPRQDSRRESPSHTALNNLTDKNKPSWKPFPNIWSRMAVFCTIGAIIIVLEILLHVSQKKNGLGDAVEDGRMHYLWTTLPSLVMMLISLFIGTLDSNARALSPYASLQKPKGVGFEVLATNFVDALRLTNLLRCVRTKNFGIISTTLAALIASFLTIVTSGLFSAIDVPQTISMNFTQETRFVTHNPMELMQDTPSLSVANYIIMDNLSYPRWTYRNLVFPELSLDTNLNWSIKGDVYADIRVPAIRGTQDCIFASGKALNHSITRRRGFPAYSVYGESWSSGPDFGTVTDGSELNMFQLSFYAPYPDCPVRGSNTSTNISPSRTDLAFATDGYFAQTQRIDCAGAPEAENSTRTTYVWGYFENYTVHHITAMTCAGKVESVDTVTRFQLPGFDISPRHPPVPDESSVKVLPEINGVWTTYYLDFVQYNNSGKLPQESFNIDNMFNALIRGRYKIPKEFLRSPEYDAKVREAIQHQDGILRAQPMKTHNRVTANGTENQMSVFGKITSSNNLRVFQDEASTRVLEAMLGLILVLSVLGSVLLNTDHILPKSPGSIAAVGSLLADSNILGFCSATGRNPSNELLRRCRVHLGWLDDAEISSELEDVHKNRYFTIYMNSENEEKSDVQISRTHSTSELVRPYETYVEGGYI
ncbi:uncharacterized protein N7469_008139 [Penicillium citrinum]|uniref:Uncharacterized protein n=1 Tax=Penicillium citrinum TaxID=5077 RepID=A0A9W9NRF3_PENCI|nr:uncharacterized protein N7469_008139 [Penicillium citrinum]KAJ5224636.1 hypothetical protein N7469_008139 [Penicillium citrinum]